MAVTNRRLAVYALGLLLLGVLVYHFREMFSQGNFSFQKLLFAVRRARFSLLLLSVAVIYLCYAIRALRWMRFSRHIKAMNFWNVYGLTLAGFASLFLLGRAGEPVRPLLIARKEQVSVSSMFGIYFLERIFDTASTAVIAGFGLLSFSELEIQEGSKELARRVQTAGMVLLAGSLLTAAFLVYFRFHGAGILDGRLSGWRGASGWRLKIAEIVSGISDGLRAIRTFADLAMAILYSAIHWTLVALIYLWVARSFGGQFELINFKGAMLVLAITMVGSTLQVPGVGGGSQAASFLAFTQFFGVEKEPAAAAAIVLWLVTFVASSLGGVPLLIHEGLSLGKLRHLAEEAPLVAKESRSERDRWSENSESSERRDRGAPTE